MIPTRSRIEQWPIAIDELLVSGATWRMAAENAESASDGLVTQMAQPAGTEWNGRGAEAALDAAFSDRLVAYRSAEVMRELADRASAGADELQAEHNAVTKHITQIESEGFIVGEDLSVVDQNAYSDPVTFMQRQALAEEYRGMLTFRAGRLAEADAEVAMHLNRGAAELLGQVPAENQGSGIQLVDHTTEDPTPTIGPFPVPPSVKRHEPPLPPPAPPIPAPPWQQELDEMRKRIDEQGQTIQDLQEASMEPTTAGIGTAIVGGCASAAVPVAIAGAITGPIDGPLTAGACVVGSAAGLTSYLAGIWVSNAVQ